jgi:hypothetical protein
VKQQIAAAFDEQRALMHGLFQDVRFCKSHGESKVFKIKLP